MELAKLFKVSNKQVHNWFQNTRCAEIAMRKRLNGANQQVAKIQTSRRKCAKCKSSLEQVQRLEALDQLIDLETEEEQIKKRKEFLLRSEMPDSPCMKEENDLLDGLLDLETDLKQMANAELAAAFEELGPIPGPSAQLVTEDVDVSMLL